MKLIERNFKKEIKDLVRIQDVQDDRFDVYLRLDKNERLLPFSQKDLNDFKRKVTSESLSGYGELGPVYRSLAKYLKVKEDQVFLAAGSDLAIKSIYEACIERGDNIVLHMPSYAMYKVYAKMFGAEIRGVSVKQDWGPDIEAMLNLVDNRTKFLCLESPNGFVGTSVHLEQIKNTAAKLLKKNVFLVIDEAYHYIENGRSKVTDLINEYPNIIITQTFSKGHGLAGVRVGHLIGNAEVISTISRVKPMHEITTISALAVQWILDNPHTMTDYQKSIKISKAYLHQELMKIDVDFRDTHGNFMLLYFPNEGRTLNIAERLKDKKILIRRPFEESFLKGWSRVCVGSLQDSKIFINTLKKLL